MSKHTPTDEEFVSEVDSGFSFEQTDLVAEQVIKEINDAVLADGRNPNIVRQVTQPHVIRAVCHMAAFSQSAKEISKATRIPKANIHALLRAPTVKKEIARIQRELYSQDFRKMFQRMVPVAANTAYKILRSKTAKDSARLMAADMILDRAVGKPTQYVETKTSLIKEVIHMLNQESSALPPPSPPFVGANGAAFRQDVSDAEIISPRPAESAQTRDPIEDLIDDIQNQE